MNNDKKFLLILLGVLFFYILFMSLNQNENEKLPEKIEVSTLEFNNFINKIKFEGI